MIFEEKGQITVFLSLLLLVLIGFSFVVVEGVSSYSASALGEDAVKNAGENVLANYDRELFNKYHIFFLDPREKNYILSDGKAGVDQYFSGNSFFNVFCNSLEMTEEVSAVEEDGLYLKHEIREWMKYRQEEKMKDALKQLINNVKKNNADRKEYQNEVGEDTGNIEQSEENKAAEDKAEEETVSQEVQKERTTWKEIKEALQLLTKTGILFYVSDHPEQLSRKSIPEGNLPSRAKKREQEEHKVEEFLFSESGLKGIKSMLSVDFSINTDSILWTKENYIVPYIEECFLDYSEEGREGKEEKNDVQEQVLAYEKEYLIKGQPSDLDNLKRVANDILLLRFINNYIFTGRDAEIQSQVNLMASALTGVVGIPQTAKAVQMMLRAVLSYGESLLELHTLFEGGEISLTKDRGNWNLELKTMVKQLKEKKTVKKGKHNISYKDYLKVLLFMKGNSTILCYRMMDIMQENTACKEAGFLMENCLFSYKWEGSLSFGSVKMKFEKQVSY
nr:DUF5702 domain-containing protein [uncultured Anaerobutyricum sp.]